MLLDAAPGAAEGGGRTMKDPCAKCKIKKFCCEQPEDLSCEDIKKIWKVGDNKEAEEGE